jgi:hypothetical protein
VRAKKNERKKRGVSTVRKGEKTRERETEMAATRLTVIKDRRRQQSQQAPQRIPSRLLQRVESTIRFLPLSSVLDNYDPRRLMERERVDFVVRRFARREANTGAEVGVVEDGDGGEEGAVRFRVGET